MGERQGGLERCYEPAQGSLAPGIAPGRGSANHTHKYLHPSAPPPRHGGIYTIHDLHEFTQLQPLSAKPGRKGADVPPASQHASELVARGHNTPLSISSERSVT